MAPTSTIVVCPGCEAKNRVATNRLSDGPKCGQCGAALPPINFDKPVMVTDASFNQEVFAAPVPVLVDCWAPWCGPCRMVGPILDELAQTYSSRLKIVKLNVDENQVTAARYKINSIPTLLLVKEGRVIDTLVGAPAKNELVRRIEQLIT